jgi:MoaA/NifB/PqqE/SkfB family radical SAM enzyme
LRRTLVNLAHHLAGRRPAGWYPLLAVCYLTYACPYRCAHCSDGSGRPYRELPSDTLSPERFLDLLAVVRRYCDHVVLTGGEPAAYPGLAAVLDGLPRLGFDSVTLTTRSPELVALLPVLLERVQHLVISLDTLDPRRGDPRTGAPAGTHAALRAMIEEAARLSGAGCEVLVSAVATRDNLDELPALLDWVSRLRLTVAVCPELDGVKVDPVLAGDGRYRSLYDRLIAARAAGGRVHGSTAYLEHMRDLAPFACRPSTVLTVSPTGEVFHPCLEIGRPAGNLLATPDLHRLRAEAVARLGPEPACDTRCHSACALGLSLGINRPFAGLGEGLRRLWPSG